MEQRSRIHVPGFVDLQVNGYLGTSFTSTALTRESLVTVCRALLADGGCVAIMPTVVTTSREIYAHALPLIAELIEDAASVGLEGRILGIHLEGPFISAEPGAKGTHPAAHCAAPSIERFEELQAFARGHVKLVTIAAERAGAAEFCRWAVAHGVVVSLGHMLAGASDVCALADAGATLLTHLGNGLPNLVHRHETSLWASLAEDRLSAMLITDGQHLRSESIVTFVRAKGLKRTILTSDVAPVAGLADGVYACFGTQVRVEGEYVRNATEPCLAGSGALMLRCVNHLASIALVRSDGGGGGAGGSEAPRRLTREELVQVAFRNPLRAIGLDPEVVLDAWSARAPLVRWRGVEGDFVLA